MKNVKLLGIALLMAVSTFAVACNKKGDDPVGPTPTPTPTPSTDPIENDSGLPTEIQYFDEPGIMIHYVRYKDSYKPWGLWLWSEGLEGAEYEFNYSDDYGVIAYYPLAKFNYAKSMGFIVKQLFSYAGEGEWIKDDIQGDRFLDIDMLQMDEHKVYNVYLANNAAGVYTDPERKTVMRAVKYCEFDNAKTIKVEANDNIKEVVVKKNGTPMTTGASVSIKGKVVTITLESVADISDMYSVEVIFDENTKCEKGVSIRRLYDAEFDKKYNYDGELGAIYTKEKTTFKVWSPISQTIELRIYDNGTPISVDPTKGSELFVKHDMVKGEKGVFSVEVEGDLEGKYYTYFVKNSSYPLGKEVVDPYAYSAGVNGLRGMIVDFSKTNPSGWDEVDYLSYDRKELAVYETHIAELTCSETWNGTKENAKLFKGFYESGTHYTKDGKDVKTGFDHIKELGVNAVQIIPFFDQANDETNMTFNWGYNPLNYNVIEGGYSSDPYDGYARIRELKELVKAYHDAGITIIMDVVYNHVNGLGGCQFDVLMPYYYFRYNKEGQASNGSGCGNETASDKYMYRRFMIDSTCFWTKEYKLGGFRFDLMGIHDVETMNLLTAANKKINSHAVIYGEPWAGGTTALPAGFDAAVQGNASKFVGYGAFNDLGRDAMLKSGMNAAYNRGWVTQDKWTTPTYEITDAMKGITSASTTDDPDKTVNYATCHDNYTIHDRFIVADTGNTDIDPQDYISEADIEKGSNLANAIVFASQGTSFMLAGEEMLRTKIVYDADGNPVMAKNEEGESLGVYEVSGNSYSSVYKTNELNYEWKINHEQLFKNYQKYIALKRNVSALHAGKEARINTESLNNNSVIKATFGDNTKQYVCYFVSPASGKTSPTGAKYEPITVDTTGYSLYVDSLGRSLTASMTLQPYEVLILEK